MVRPTRVITPIRPLGEAAGRTQADLAASPGVTRQTLSAIEQGRYSPTLELAFQLANALDRPLTDVFAYPEEP